jgi:hypothetical protein
MKRFAGLVVLVVLAVFFLSGCATIYPVGSLYTGVKLPTLAGDGSNVSYSKVGVSKATSILSLIATGDASIDAAVKNGNIKSIKYVDWHVNNILGIYGEYTTTVYGD